MLVKENDTVKILYQQSNHKHWYPKMGELTKDNGTNVIKSPNDISIGNPNSQQKINLGWVDPSTYWNLCSTLRRSYQHVFLATTSQGTWCEKIIILWVQSISKRETMFFLDTNGYIIGGITTKT